MKKVLVITYYWPPSGGSGVQRWVKFAKYLLGEGWQCVVCTPENPDLIAEDSTLGAEIPPEVEVLRRPIAEPYAFAASRYLCMVKISGFQIAQFRKRRGQTMEQRL